MISMGICKCGKISRDGQRHCNLCHASYMRSWRKTHAMNSEQRFKDISRSYAGVYKRRGKIQIMPCEVCGSNNAEMHHDFYEKPLSVRWLCRYHHIKHHNSIIS